MENQAQAPEFQLSNSTDRFADKTKNVFGCLSILEIKHEEHQKAHQTSYDDLLKKDPNEDDTRTIEKIAKYKHHGEKHDLHSDKPYIHSQNRSYGRPWHTQDLDRHFKCPPKPFSHRRCHGHDTPDYELHPDRWTAYSLHDVSNSDMSDSSNTQAAFKFLDERKRLRELEGHSEEDAPADLDGTACSKMAIKFVRRQDRKGQKINSQSCSTSSQKEVALLDVEEIENEDEIAEVCEKNINEKVSFKRKRGNKKNFRSRASQEEVKDD
ncbi:uncharacterized protein [Haliotis asinina]